MKWPYKKISISYHIDRTTLKEAIENLKKLKKEYGEDAELSLDYDERDGMDVLLSYKPMKGSNGCC